MRWLYSPADGPLAQLVEQGTLNPKVEGSNPSRPTCRAASQGKPTPIRRTASGPARTGVVPTRPTRRREPNSRRRGNPLECDPDVPNRFSERDDADRSAVPEFLQVE